MQQSSIAKYLKSWALQRDKKRLRLDALRRRDGDNCRRCRRPMCFDLPRGHDKAPVILQILPQSDGGKTSLENLCLCHSRCNPESGCSTPVVKERRRLRQVDGAASLPWA